MSRLIDADALMHRMYHDAFETDTDMQKWDSGCWIRYKMFENAIDDAPTIDIDRPQGEWIEQEECWQCSECGDEYVLEVGVKPIDARMNYCPNCGASMKGADDE